MREQPLLTDDQAVILLNQSMLDLLSEGATEADVNDMPELRLLSMYRRTHKALHETARLLTQCQSERDAAMRDQVSNNMTVLRWQESYAEVAAERDAWKKAALHCGENYWGGVGPDGYYSFTAQQFMAWLKGE